MTEALHEFVFSFILIQSSNVVYTNELVRELYKNVSMPKMVRVHKNRSRILWHPFRSPGCFASGRSLFIEEAASRHCLLPYCARHHLPCYIKQFLHSGGCTSDVRWLITIPWLSLSDQSAYHRSIVLWLSTRTFRLCTIARIAL